MSLVSEAKQFGEKNTGVLISRCHKIAAATDKSGESEDGVFLSFSLSLLTCVYCWLSGGGLTFSLAPRFPGGVCGFELF